MNISQALLHQRAPTTPIEDKSNIITIVTWATLVLSVLVFLARQCIKLVMRRKAGIDDLFIFAATVFSVGLSVTILILARDGHIGDRGALTLKRAAIIQKGYYASDFLYISTLGFAKLSLLSFFYSVHHQRGQRRIVLAIGVFILAWTLASLAAVAFQCGLPKPWETLTLHCFNTGVFWIAYCIIDMTSDVTIIMLSVNLVAYLKVRLSTKVAVVACFAPRILVIGAALTRLIYLYPVSPHHNPEYNLWVPLICTQAQACVSILTACIPYVRPFFETTESSMRRRSQARSRHGIIDEESYGCCSGRGYKKAQGHSEDSTPFTNSAYGITPDASPRIPTPVPVSPLTPPRFITPPNTAVNGSRSPSQRGLRLYIPDQNEIRATVDIASPQTASSHALSPTCWTPHPLLSSIALAPVRSSLVPAAEQSRSKSAVAGEHSVAPSPSHPQPPRRFSLFPSPQQQYSPLPQHLTRPAVSIPTPIAERSRSNTVTESEAQTPLTNAPLFKPTTPHLMFPPSQSSSLERVAFDDPIRYSPITPIAVTTSAAIPAPLFSHTVPPVVHHAHSSVPSYYTRTPSTAQNSTFSSAQSVPSYYMTAPPVAQPSAFSQSNSYAYYTPPPPTIPPKSPQRQRNNRILTPQNSSRRDQMSPVSPISPPTPLAFWREENSIHGTPRIQGSRDGWEDAEMMPVVQDVRNSPRVVVQRLS